jgi:DNA mismatch repair protein, C-terminal domain
MCGAAGVSITLKRHKQVKAVILTLAHFTRKDCVRAAYGSDIANHLAPLRCRSNWPDEHAAAPLDTRDEPTFSVDGLITLPSATCKKTVIVLFINGRPVDCHSLKICLEGAYASLHSKASFWAFLDVRRTSTSTCTQPRRRWRCCTRRSWPTRCAVRPSTSLRQGTKHGRSCAAGRPSFERTPMSVRRPLRAAVEHHGQLRLRRPSPGACYVLRLSSVEPRCRGGAQVIGGR